MANPQPGPRQVGNSQIVSINFSPGLVLFVRVHWSAGATTAISRPDAQVKELPWDTEDFNIFEGNNNVVDPKADSKLSRAIVNPVTNDMLAVYRYWQPKDPVFTTKSKNGTKTKWVIDYACWQGSINGFPNFQFACGPDKDLIEQQMYDSWFEHYGFPTDRSLFKVFLSDGLRSIAPPPSQEFWDVSAASVADGHPPWTAHEEPDGDSSETVAEADAVMIFQVGKMRGAQKADPVTKKKPDTLSFVITVPHNYDKATTAGGFKLQVGLFATAKPSTPPKPGDENKRRNFPLIDKVVEGELQYLVADWSPFPKEDHTNDIEIAGFTTDQVRIKMDFTDKKKLPVVTLVRE